MCAAVCVSVKGIPSPSLPNIRKGKQSTAHMWESWAEEMGFAERYKKMTRVSSFQSQKEKFLHGQKKTKRKQLKFHVDGNDIDTHRGMWGGRHLEDSWMGGIKLIKTQEGLFLSRSSETRCHPSVPPIRMCGGKNQKGRGSSSCLHASHQTLTQRLNLQKKRKEVDCYYQFTFTFFVFSFLIIARFCVKWFHGAPFQPEKTIEETPGQQIKIKDCCGLVNCNPSP